VTSPVPAGLSGRCPICASPLEAPVALPRLEIARCPECGHRVASHAATRVSAGDYHEQYEDALAEALRTTRIRQAARIIALARKHVPDLSGVVDYGAGRGWFLHTCRSAGIAPLAGADTSRLAVKGLLESGIEAHLLGEEDSGADVLTRLSFSPRVLTLLDVVEHFPPDEIEARIRTIAHACGSGLELVVIKVPVPGLLYSGAAALRRTGVPGPLLQLYQSGTWPPHFNYFSRDSLRRLVASAGLSAIEELGDPDFDPSSFGLRIGIRSAATRALARLGAQALSAIVSLTRSFDSLLVLARPRPGRTASGRTA
jgi:Methyltransferase domain